MSRKTKIFISSSSQTELKSIRQRSFDHLSLLGHEPIIFESNMGPWHSQTDMVQNCIEYVRGSDLFVLFLANLAGTYMLEDDITVTHLELETAYENKKICTVFVEQTVYQLFFDSIRQKIRDALTLFNEANHKEPESLYRQIIVPLTDELPSHIDPYIWSFLYDIAIIKGIYMNTVDFDTDIVIKILTDDLTSLLAEGSSLLPYKAQIARNMEAIEEHNRYWGFSTKFMGMVKMKNPDAQTWREFLHTLQISLKGGVVEYLKGKYRREILGSVENCSGSTLYRLDDSILARIAGSGDAGGKDFYTRDETTSFIVQASLQVDEVMLFYEEIKNQVYITIKIDRYVGCFHFKLSTEWNRTKVMSFQDTLINAILSMKGNHFMIHFSKLILGGIDYD